MTSRTGGARVTIQEQVDELLAKMTPAEKAGQLTQYFYFRLPEDAPGPVLDFDPDEQPRMVESKLQRGRRRFAAVRHRSGRDQPAAAARGRGQPARHPGAVRVRRHPRAAHDLPGADRDGRLLGPRDHRGGPGGRRPGGAGRGHPLDVRADGRHRPRPALGSDHRGRRRGPVPRRRGRGRAGARLPGPASSARPSGSSPGPSTSPATAPRSAAATTTRSTCPTPSCGTSYLPPFQAAIEAGAGNVMTAYMDLNGIPATGNRWLFTDVLRDTLGLRGLRGQRRQRRAQPASPTASPPT